MNEKKSFFSKFVINPFLTISVFILYFFSCFNLITGFLFIFSLSLIFYYFDLSILFSSLITLIGICIINPFLYYSVYPPDIEKDYLLEFIEIHCNYKTIELFKEIKKKTKLEYDKAESIKKTRILNFKTEIKKSELLKAKNIKRVRLRVRTKKKSILNVNKIKKIKKFSRFKVKTKKK